MTSVRNNSDVSIVLITLLPEQDSMSEIHNEKGFEHGISDILFFILSR